MKWFALVLFLATLSFAQKQVDLSKLTVDQLKSLAYDQMAVIEQSQRNLQALNQEIANRGQQKPPKVKTEKGPHK